MITSLIGLMILTVPEIVLATESVSAENSDGAAHYEAQPVFKASEILTPDMLSGEHFQVKEEVGSDGYWDIYTVETESGEFVAHGWLDLRTLIQEIDAMAKLVEMSKSGLFIESMVENGILEPIDLVVTIVSHPVQTVTGIPRGIKNMFLRFGRKAKKVTDTAGKIVKRDDDEAGDPRLKEACEQGNEPYPGACDEEGYADDFKKLAGRYFKVDEAVRKWHAELNTDPYSSNEALQAAIREVSWAGGLGQFGLKYTPLAGVKAISMTRKIYKITWSTDPFELRKSLENSLIELGIDDESRKYFMDNPFMTLTRQTFIVESLKNIEAVEGMETLLDWAADSRNEDEALYSASTVALIAWMDSQSQITRILPNTILPVIETDDGRIMAMLPIDYLSWTEEVATIIEAATLREDTRNIANREIWLTTRCSDLARAKIESLGWTITENGAEAVLASGEDLEL
jgi:hypothetical protein